MRIYLILFILITLFSCENQGESREKSVAAEAEPQASFASVEMDEQAPAASPVITERKLIKNGTLNFEVEDVKKAKAEVDKIITEFNAYTSSDDQNNFDDRLQYNQVIRVSANRFEELIIKVESLALKIENKNINSQDVTEEFIDVEARLKTKKHLENRYREILKQAKTVADIISIESQIANVRGEIESMEGRLNFLKSQVSLSTLTLTYYEKIGTDFGFGSKFTQSLGNGWDNLLSFFIGLVSIWPFLLIIGIGIWLFLRRKLQKN